MDDFEKLSGEAKQAWRRGFDLAYPRDWRGMPSPEAREARAKDGTRAAAADAVAAALAQAVEAGGESLLAVKSGKGVRLVVMDPLSVEAVIGELDNLETDECREALGEGFLRGMIAKARAAGAQEPEASPALVN
jgi:hypothetical protein